ncbi:hypothetical protein GCM10029976_089690 [Kribbella albertanoniae]|uniref:MFS transporter n=1 Tax=Kribbella albertanoniae TaxID=1266829 RepID=A0A4R4PQ58_9ACTN|nr:MFS transporter [Kribbella albertanoniae]TDC24400.1 MFS transporter [Kribbella albertanoniae]
MTARSEQLQIGVGLSSMGFLLAGLGACVAILARDLDEPTGRLALLSSAFAVGLVIIAAVGPALLRSWSIDVVLRVGSLVCAAGGALIALAPVYVVVVVGGLCVGLGGALLVLVAPLMLHGPTAAARLSRVNAVASAAGILAPLTIGLVDALGISGRVAMLVAVPPLLVLATVKGPDVVPPVFSEAPTGHAVGWTVGLGWLRVVLAVGVEFCFVVWAVARLVDSGLTLAVAALLGSSFPIGMAVGRAIGPVHWRSLPPVVIGGSLAIIGTLLVSLLNAPALIAVGLVIAGIGVAPLYPVTLAALVAMPGLSPTRLAALGALASGTAILITPAALAALARLVNLRLAYLITIPLLLALFLLSRRTDADRQAITTEPSSSLPA